MTDVDPTQGQPAYWYAKPPVVTVGSPEFEPLWEAAQRAVRDAGFRPDRLDYRHGIITTQPLVSQQAFEVWKRDVASLPDLAQSTLQTVRRTVRFEIAKKPDGSYELAPKVLVERYSFTEHRITSVALYREVFALTREEAYRRRDLQQNPTQAPSPIPPPDYWYPIARDEAMERRLADWIKDQLPDAHVGASPASPASPAATHVASGR